MLDMLYWWIYFLFYSVYSKCYLITLTPFIDMMTKSIPCIVYAKKPQKPIAYNFSIIICDVFINMLGKLTIALSLTSKHMQMTF